MNLTTDMIVDLVLNIINIIVLFLIVRFLVFKPVKKFMNARTERVNSQRKEAEKLALEAKEKSARCDELLKESEKAKTAAIKEGESLGRAEAQKLIADANQKAAMIVDTANMKTEAERKKMLEDARVEVLNLSLQISSKLLSRNVNDDDNKKIVEKFLGMEKLGDENA